MFSLTFVWGVACGAFLVSTIGFLAAAFLFELAGNHKAAGAMIALFAVMSFVTIGAFAFGFLPVLYTMHVGPMPMYWPFWRMPMMGW